MSEFEFQPWPKIARLNRDIIVTEKIDGTNAAVLISKDGQVGAQSRKRLITPDDDNFDFAAWAVANAGALVDLLGPGRHFGEWWGSGIQRGYGLTNGERRFSLFNTARYGELPLAEVDGLATTPVLYQGHYLDFDQWRLLSDLELNGSVAAPGFMRPEGIVVFHVAANEMFKVTLENDEQPKGQVA